jgi:hypothetical protein
MGYVSLRTISVVALAVLAGAGASQAWAKGISFNSLTAAQFISSCEKMGGTVSRPGTGVIRCKLPSGTVVDCSFDSSGTVCTWKGDLPTADSKKLMGDPSPATVNPGTGTTKPKAPDASGATDTVN